LTQINIFWLSYWQGAAGCMQLLSCFAFVRGRVACVQTFVKMAVRPMTKPHANRSGFLLCLAISGWEDSRPDANWAIRTGHAADHARLDPAAAIVTVNRCVSVLPLGYFTSRAKTSLPLKSGCDL
jgi:hypothetical protein